MKQRKSLEWCFAASILAVMVGAASCTGGPVQGGWFGSGGFIPGSSSGPGPSVDGGASIPVTPQDGGTTTPVTPSSITLTGRVLSDTGVSVANATLSVASQTVGTTDPTGAFSFTRPVATGNLVISSSAPSLAPGVTVVPLKSGVTSYVVPITMAHLQTQPIVASGTTTMNVPMLGKSVQLTIPPGAPSGSIVRVASYSPGTQLPPGIMAPSGDPTSGLRTIAMFYYDIVDSSGSPIASPPTGVRVTIPATAVTSIPMSQPFEQWQMGQDGTWQDPTLTAQPTLSTPVTLSPAQFGFWNSDHAYKTACVTGTLSQSAGTCGGARVQALGVDNLSSFDSSGADGSFCVTGAQTRSSKLIVGTSSTTVVMPSSAGDCSVPTSCEDIGAVTVPDDQCQAAPAVGAGVACGTPAAAGSTTEYSLSAVANEGQGCAVSCASGTITSISVTYAPNCSPTPCPGAAAGCAGAQSCTVTVSNSACGGDPCVNTPKGATISMTCGG